MREHEVSLVGKIMLGIGVNLWLYFLPVIPLILAVGAFIVADTICGVWAAYITGEKITSHKMGRVVVKLIAYTAVILLIHTFDTVILSHFYEGMIVTRLGAGVLMYIEAYSIDEKVRKMNNDKGAVHYLRSVSAFVKEVKSELTSLIKDTRR